MRDFVGRQREIEALVRALSATGTEGSAAAISGVRGMGGIGKTALAYVSLPFEEMLHFAPAILPDRRPFGALRSA